MNRSILTILLAAALADCSVDSVPPVDPASVDQPITVGYSGPLPSIAARDAIDDLAGQIFVDKTGALGGGEFFVSGFAVVPNPITISSAPVVLLSRETSRTEAKWFDPQGKDGEYWVVVKTDADVADFTRRIRGAPPFGAKGNLSKNYRESVGIVPKSR
jgi:hypothetical protein